MPALVSATPIPHVGGATTITGEGFVPGAAVTITILGVPITATGVTVTTSSSITATLPAGVYGLGLVMLTVTNPGGPKASSSTILSIVT